jgi:hypothetical protein
MVSQRCFRDTEVPPNFSTTQGLLFEFSGIVSGIPKARASVNGALTSMIKHADPARAVLAAI